MLVAQSCLTLFDPMDCSLLGSSVHGILQARILEWVAIPFSRGSSRSRYRTQVSCIAGRFFTIWATREAHVGTPPNSLNCVLNRALQSHLVQAFISKKLIQPKPRSLWVNHHEEWRTQVVFGWLCRILVKCLATVILVFWTIFNLNSYIWPDVTDSSSRENNLD